MFDKYSELYHLELHFTCRNKEEITAQILSEVSVLILAGPRAQFTENEFYFIKEFVERGGSLLVTLAEGGENVFKTNVNYLLEEYGMMINSGK